MKDFDFHFEEPEQPEDSVNTVNSINEENYDFKNIDYNSLLMYHVINRCYSMKELLEGLGIYVKNTNMYCPFHDDALTGKPSAKFHQDTDSLYCFSESKSYTAYHVLKILYNANMQEKFNTAWKGLSEADRERMLIEYSKDSNPEKLDFINPIWKQLAVVTSKFSKGEVTLHQHRNALYKCLEMLAQ